MLHPFLSSSGQSQTYSLYDVGRGGDSGRVGCSRVPPCVLHVVCQHWDRTFNGFTTIIQRRCSTRVSD